MKISNNISFIIGILAMAGAIVIANLNSESAEEIMSNPQNWILAGFFIFIILVMMALLRALDSMKNLVLKHSQAASDQAVAGEEAAQSTEAANADAPKEERSIVQIIMQKLTRSTPVEKEEEIDLDHNYDGIRELDNKLPPWWVWGFYITIAWAVIYLVRTHVLDLEPTPKEEYEIAMAEAEKQKEEYMKTQENMVDEKTVSLLTAESALQEGQQLFNKHCAVCHQKDGGGSVGPNLTDQYWLHGNKIGDIFSTIKYGVPEKGMISWQDQLNPKQMQKVASYVKSMEGTTPSDPKEPQGELIKPSEESGESASDSANAKTAAL